MKKYRLYKICKPTQIATLVSSGNSTKIIAELIAAHNAGDDVYAVNPEGVKIRARKKTPDSRGVINIHLTVVGIDDPHKCERIVVGIDGLYKNDHVRLDSTSEPWMIAGDYIRVPRSNKIEYVVKNREHSCGETRTISEKRFSSIDEAIEFKESQVYSQFSWWEITVEYEK